MPDRNQLLAELKADRDAETATGDLRAALRADREEGHPEPEGVIWPESSLLDEAGTLVVRGLDTALALAREATRKQIDLTVAEAAQRAGLMARPLAPPQPQRPLTSLREYVAPVFDPASVDEASRELVARMRPGEEATVAIQNLARQLPGLAGALPMFPAQVAQTMVQEAGRAGEALAGEPMPPRTRRAPLMMEQAQAITAPSPGESLLFVPMVRAARVLLPRQMQDRAELLPPLLSGEETGGRRLAQEPAYIMTDALMALGGVRYAGRRLGAADVLSRAAEAAHGAKAPGVRMEADLARLRRDPEMRRDPVLYPILSGDRPLLPSRGVGMEAPTPAKQLPILRPPPTVAAGPPPVTTPSPVSVAIADAVDAFIAARRQRITDAEAWTRRRVSERGFLDVGALRETARLPERGFAALGQWRIEYGTMKLSEPLWSWYTSKVGEAATALEMRVVRPIVAAATLGRVPDVGRSARRYFTETRGLPKEVLTKTREHTYNMDRLGSAVMGLSKAIPTLPDDIARDLYLARVDVKAPTSAAVGRAEREFRPFFDLLSSLGREMSAVGLLKERTRAWNEPTYLPRYYAAQAAERIFRRIRERTNPADLKAARVYGERVRARGMATEEAIGGRITQGELLAPLDTTNLKRAIVQGVWDVARDIESTRYFRSLVTRPDGKLGATSAAIPIAHVIDARDHATATKTAIANGMTRGATTVEGAMEALNRRASEINVEVDIIGRRDEALVEQRIKDFQAQVVALSDPKSPASMAAPDARVRDLRWARKQLDASRKLLRQMKRILPNEPKLRQRLADLEAQRDTVESSTTPYRNLTKKIQGIERVLERRRRLVEAYGLPSSAIALPPPKVRGAGPQFNPHTRGLLERYRELETLADEWEALRNLHDQDISDMAQAAQTVDATLVDLDATEQRIARSVQQEAQNHGVEYVPWDEAFKGRAEADPKSIAARRWGALRGAWINRDLLVDLDLYRMRPEGLNAQLHAAMGTWRMLLTVYNLKTHILNSLGNIPTAHMGGQDLRWMPAYNALSTRLIRDNHPTVEAARKAGLNLPPTVTALDVRQTLRKVTGMSDLEAVGMEKVRDWFASTPIAKLYAAEDGIKRFSFYLDAIARRGMTPEDAATAANYWIIDSKATTQASTWASQVSWFINYSLKYTGRLARAAFERPVRTAFWMGAPFWLGELAQETGALPEGHAERRRKYMPPWNMREVPYSKFWNSGVEKIIPTGPAVVGGAIAGGAAGVVGGAMIGGLSGAALGLIGGVAGGGALGLGFSAPKTGPLPFRYGGFSLGSALASQALGTAIGGPAVGLAAATLGGFAGAGAPPGKGKPLEIRLSAIPGFNIGPETLELNFPPIGIFELAKGRSPTTGRGIRDVGRETVGMISPFAADVWDLVRAMQDDLPGVDQRVVPGEERAARMWLNVQPLSTRRLREQQKKRKEAAAAEQAARNKAHPAWSRAFKVQSRRKAYREQQ